MKTASQVNQPSELSEVPKAEASEAAENQLEKRRSPSHRQISDLIEARNLADPTDRSKKFFNSLPRQNPRNSVPKPRGPARLRARPGYTDTPPTPQAPNDRFTNYLHEPESQKRKSRPRNATAYIECANRQAGTENPRPDHELAPPGTPHGKPPQTPTSRTSKHQPRQAPTLRR